MHTALGLTAARGWVLGVLTELLPAAKAGLVASLSTDRGRDDGP